MEETTDEAASDDIVLLATQLSALRSRLSLEEADHTESKRAPWDCTIDDELELSMLLDAAAELKAHEVGDGNVMHRCGMLTGDMQKVKAQGES